MVQLPAPFRDGRPRNVRNFSLAEMEDLIETVTRGNPTEVKVILASVALALAVYQLVLISVAYGKVKPPFLGAPPASRAHRAVGDSIVAVLVVVAVMCVGYFGFEDDATLHIVAAVALLSVLALKILVVRRWHAMSRFLPALGISVWLLLALTWLTSAGDFLSGS
jgi:small-conductance mechanosensitive channel